MIDYEIQRLSEENRHLIRFTDLHEAVDRRVLAGLVLDMWTEKSNDDISYDKLATQEDFDKF